VWNHRHATFKSTVTRIRFIFAVDILVLMGYSSSVYNIVFCRCNGLFLLNAVNVHLEWINLEGWNYLFKFNFFGEWNCSFSLTGIVYQMPALLNFDIVVVLLIEIKHPMLKLWYWFAYRYSIYLGHYWNTCCGCWSFMVDLIN